MSSNRELNVSVLLVDDLGCELLVMAVLGAIVLCEGVLGAMVLCEGVLGVGREPVVCEDVCVCLKLALFDIRFKWFSRREDKQYTLWGWQ